MKLNKYQKIVDQEISDFRVHFDRRLEDIVCKCSQRRSQPVEVIPVESVVTVQVKLGVC